MFRFDVFHLYESLENYSKLLYLISVHILEGSGIFIAGILGLYFLKKERKTTISLFGTSKNKSILMAIVPVILLTIIGVGNKYGFDPHLYGFIAGFGTLVYCIMEEYGWRGYLEEEFKGLKVLVRVLLIGFIWYFWHLSFLTEASLIQNLFFLGVLIFGSWGIGKVAEMTKSILASACFHLIVNLFMFNQFFNQGISLNKKLIVVLFSVTIFMVVLSRWNKTIDK